MKKINLVLLGITALLSGCSTCTSCKGNNCQSYFALGCNKSVREETVVTQTPRYTEQQYVEQQYVAPQTSREVVNTVAEPVNNSKIRYYVVEQDSSCISETAAIKAPLVSKDVKVNESDYRSFSNRVAVKASSDNFVTYEYRDIRVDELMPLAAHYCSEHGDRTAILRKINLYHGYYRRVTFDCVRL